MNVMQNKFPLLVFFFLRIMCIVQLFFAFAMLKMQLCIVALSLF